MPDVATLAIISGSVSILAGSFLALVRLAIGQTKERADDWREIARTERETGAIRDGHVERLVGAVEELTLAQRESLTMLRSIVNDLAAAHGRDVA